MLCHRSTDKGHHEDGALGDRRVPSPGDWPGDDTNVLMTVSLSWDR